MEQVKPFGWRRSLDYFKTNLVLTCKALFEYKANFYVSIFEQFWYYITYFVFFVVVSDNFSSVVNWSFADFLLFALIIDFIHVGFGLFFWNFDLQSSIVRGDLNSNIIRPINPLVSYSFFRLSKGAIFFIISNFLVFPIFILYFGYEFHNIFLSFIIGLLIYLDLIFMGMFVVSISFFSFGLADFLGEVVGAGIHQISKNYPFQFFERTAFKVVLLGIPLFFTSSLLMPLLKGVDVWNMKLQLMILFCTLIFFLMGSLLSWHYGLKKYEAFG